MAVSISWDSTKNLYSVSIKRVGKEDFDFIVGTLRLFPLTKRTYEGSTKTWYIVESCLQPFYSILTKKHIHVSVKTRENVERELQAQEEEKRVKAERLRKEFEERQRQHQATMIPSTANNLALLKASFLALMPNKELQLLGDLDIRKAYKKAAQILHPDLGGDSEKMARLNQVYEDLKRFL